MYRSFGNLQCTLKKISFEHQVDHNDFSRFNYTVCLSYHYINLPFFPSSINIHINTTTSFDIL